MEEDVKVFSSKITRGLKKANNNLYELLKIDPAKPTVFKNAATNNCEFHPRTDKYYEPKKKSKLKVKTVRDIRTFFEKDVNSTLTEDLEKQENILLKKIRDGSSKHESSKILAKNMLKCNNPISRTAWQMLINMNPEEYAHPSQYVLWSGKPIRVSGSKGGNNKFICRNDLNKRHKSLKTRKSFKKSPLNNKKKGLLQNSLSVKFKPGPLTLKKHLDDSYQKYHVGNIEVVDLPKPGLDIQSSYGCSLEPTITSFLNNLRDANGLISKKWAEFSVSVLGTINNGDVIQTNKNCCMTFDLSYKCDQSRILMRLNVDDSKNNEKDQNNIFTGSSWMEKDCNIEREVSNIINEMINCVEISLLQDTMYSREDEKSIGLQNTSFDDNLIKEKPKRKYGELDRLHVTIIRLAENSEKNNPDSIACNKSYCKLGCVCPSLECPINLREHCGRVDCLFQCNCDYSQYNAVNSIEDSSPELIKGLINLDKQINSKLAKEEQKFHQTVIVTGEKSILLKTKRRNWKASKKYPDFYRNMCLKTENKEKRILTVAATKLNCENIEPWCMVHNLYKCFCNGKFADTTCSELSPQEPSINVIANHREKLNIEIEKANVSHIKKSLRPRVQHEIVNNFTLLKKSKPSKNYESSNLLINAAHDYYTNVCARVKPYKDRKFSNGYYTNINNKIREMEQNDNKLLKRLTKIAGSELTCMNTETNIRSNNNVGVTNAVNRLENPDSTKSTSRIVADEEPQLSFDHIVQDVLSSNSTSISQDSPLKPWLEYTFKQYKQSCNKGLIKTTLQPPKLNKVVLYTWNFILDRYKEKKNHFMVSKQKPYRIFMAVETDSIYFQNCININDIRLADLHKYPIIVRNLLTNATDLEDSFCILNGLSHCWELKAAVTKINETVNNHAKDDNTEVSHSDSDSLSLHSIDDSAVVEPAVQNKNELEKSHVDDNINKAESSKWFVMTVENDFNELRFFDRGFFVAYESIKRAINLARLTGKTIRLSGKKGENKNNGTQFGVYAIPNANENCVFIGPYECDEALSVETVKTIFQRNTLKSTRGFWFTTNKVDNMKVIDNPMSFMPATNNQCSDIVPLVSESCHKNKQHATTTESTSDENNETVKSGENRHEISSKNLTKVVKPITIRKTDGFYHMSRNLYKSILVNHPQESLIANGALSSVSTPLMSEELSPSLFRTSVTDTEKLVTTLEDDTPCIQISSVYSESDKIDTDMENEEKLGTTFDKDGPRIQTGSVISGSGRESQENEQVKPEGSMFVLKPEEINKRLLENKIFTNNDTESNKKEMDIDIEHFLTNPTYDSKDDIYIISDDDNEENSWREVWIECKNLKNIGWIPGRRDAENRLSFEFPGFLFTDFYTEAIAFCKINQVLSRKICMPKNIILEWHVVESESDLKSSRLKSEDFGPDIVLTTKGLRHKRDLTTSIVRNIKTYSRVRQPSISATTSEKSNEKVETFMQQSD